MSYIEEDLVDRVYCKGYIVNRISLETNNNPLCTCVSKLIIILQILAGIIRNFIWCQSDRFEYIENRRNNYHSYTRLILYETLLKFLAAQISYVSGISGFNPEMAILRNKINSEWQK